MGVGEGTGMGAGVSVGACAKEGAAMGSETVMKAEVGPGASVGGGVGASTGAGVDLGLGKCEGMEVGEGEANMDVGEEVVGDAGEDLGELDPDGKEAGDNGTPPASVCDEPPANKGKGASFLAAVLEHKLEVVVVIKRRP